MMKLIVCRHGDFDHSRRLSEAGEQQIQALAELLRPHMPADPDRHVLLLTSTAKRALGSTGVLVRAFGIRNYRDIVRRSDDLWSGDSPVLHDVRRALKFILDNDAADVVIVMTHLELCEELPPLFGREVLGMRLPVITLERGQARVIDCVAQTETVVK